MAVPVSGETTWRRSRIVVPVATPAAGADWSLTVPAGHVYHLVSLYGQLVTSAAVATRIPRLSFTDGDSVFLDLPPFASQVASLTRRYAWAPAVSGTALGNSILSYLPDLDLPAGWTIASVTDLIDAADAWTSVKLLVRDLTVRGGANDLDAMPDLLVSLVDAGPLQ